MLAWHSPTSATPSAEEALGQQLAALHAVPEKKYGLEVSNHLGHLVQTNIPLDKWSSFYRDNRLLPQLMRLIDQGFASSSLVLRLHSVMDTLENRLPDRIQPSRLHGDLWGGNVIWTPALPILIDPAVFVGDRVLDLSMMKLFGGFSDRVFQAYQRTFPLLPGWEERVPLYQLYYLLSHVCLHGPSWLPQVDHCLKKLKV